MKRGGASRDVTADSLLHAGGDFPILPRWLFFGLASIPNPLLGVGRSTVTEVLLLQQVYSSCKCYTRGVLLSYRLVGC